MSVGWTLGMLYRIRLWQLFQEADLRDKGAKSRVYQAMRRFCSVSKNGDSGGVCSPCGRKSDTASFMIRDFEVLARGRSYLQHRGRTARSQTHKV